MKRTLTVPGIVLFLSILFTGCYLAPASGSPTTFSIDLSSQGIVGDSGDGYYVRAKLFDAADIQPLLAGGDLVVDTQQFNIQYDPLALPVTVSSNVFYLGTNYPYSGVVVMANLPAGREYRVILEELYYSIQLGTSPDAINNALVTQPFIIPAGGSIVIDGGDLLPYSSPPLG